MDPLSVGSGITGLITLAGAVLSQCYNYGCAVANAPDEARRFAAELTGLSGVLVGIQGLHASKSFRDGDEMSPILAECQATLQHILQRLEAVDPIKKRNCLARLKNRMLWSLERQDTLDLIARVERQKSTLALSLGNITT